MGWNCEFHGLKLWVSRLETVSFTAWNCEFHGLKLWVSWLETVSFTAWNCELYWHLRNVPHLACSKFAAWVRSSHCLEMYRALLGVSTEFVLIEGRFYKLVSKKGRVSILLGCLYVFRAVSFCFSFSHVARYAPSRKAKTYGTIAANTSQANL